MRIVIDGRFFSVQAGIGRYIRNLITNLQSIDKKNEYFILLLKQDSEYFEEKNNFKKILTDIKWYGLAEQIKLPILLNKLNPHLVHFPHFNLPILFKGRFIVTIHDLTHQFFAMKRASSHPSLIYFLKQKGYRIVFQNAVINSTNIITPSNYVKELILKQYKIPKSKIKITYEGVDQNITKLTKEISTEKCNEIMQKFNTKPPFIFYVGNAHPHKNVEGLIKAFLILRKRYQYLKLVLAGSDKYFWPRIKKEFQYKDIIYTGFISDEELVVFYKNAQIFVMPSFEEGFGIPILEAMSIGCPVVSSNAGSLSEVGGDAGLYFNPNSTEEMVEKISEVLDLHSLREKLILKGKKRAEIFSWKKMAEETLKAYKESLS